MHQKEVSTVGEFRKLIHKNLILFLWSFVFHEKFMIPKRTLV